MSEKKNLKVFSTLYHILFLQECENEGNLRQAEHYYCESGDWKAAVNMYRAQDMWDEAHRVGVFSLHVVKSPKKV